MYNSYIKSIIFSIKNYDEFNKKTKTKKKFLMEKFQKKSHWIKNRWDCDEISVFDVKYSNFEWGNFAKNLLNFFLKKKKNQKLKIKK